MRKILLVIGLILLIAFWVGLAQAWTEPRQLTDHENMAHPMAANYGRNIYLISWRPLGEDFPFLSSWNNGFSWSEPVMPADSFYGGSPYSHIACTPNGLIHVVWTGRYGNEVWRYIFHQSSSNGGRSWSNRHAAYGSQDYFTFPKLISVGDTLFLAFRTLDNLLVKRSIDNGLTWQDSSIVGIAENMGHPPIILYSQGRLHLIYELNVASEQTGFKIFYSKSDDLGLTWTQHIYLSSPEIGPPYYDSQVPAAYADDNGHVIATWFDYQYGSYCGTSGDILARVSTDNGSTWLPESRLTDTQSGEASSCLILDNTIYVAWMDSYPYGCDYPKIVLSYSTNWGLSWSEPEIISGNSHTIEQLPFLLSSLEGQDTLMHCFYDIYNPSYGSDLFYVRSQPFLSKIKEKQDNIPMELSIKAFPNVFNSITTISYQNNTYKEASIEIYNLLGQKVWDKTVSGKEGKLMWDASSYPSGVYFAKAEAGGISKSIKLILLK